MLEDKELCELLKLPDITVAPGDRVGDDLTVHSVWESQGWWDHVVLGKERYADKPSPRSDFGTNRRNIVLALSMDGFQPWKRIAHTLTPITCMILNLPEHLRHVKDYLLLIGVIPGPKEPKPLDNYFQICIDELIVLYRDGFEFADPLNGGAPTRVYVKVLFTCADNPAHCHINRQAPAMSTYGCHKCKIQVSVTSGDQW